MMTRKDITDTKVWRRMYILSLNEAIQQKKIDSKSKQVKINNEIKIVVSPSRF